MASFAVITVDAYRDSVQPINGCIRLKTIIICSMEVVLLNLSIKN